MAMKECLRALDVSISNLKLEKTQQVRLLEVVRSANAVVNDLSQISNYSEAEHKALSESLNALTSSSRSLKSG